MLIAVLVVLGLCFGSFVDALTWRIHEQTKLSKKKSLDTVDQEMKLRLSILTGRSMCSNCKHTLAAKDLIPILSWLQLRGKCRYCHKPISWQSPIVEILTAFLFIASYIWWPVSLQGAQIVIFVLWLILIIGFVALIVYDLKWLILPNRIVYPLTYVAFALAIISIVSSSNALKAILDVFLAVLIGGGIFYVLFQASQGKWIGGGDVRLGFLLGFTLGTPGHSILMLFLASLIGSVVSLPLLITNKLKRTSVIPFGPFLIVAAIIVQLLGHSILSWYENSFFPNGV